MELTPFLQRPSIELVLTGPDGQEASSVNIIEPIGWKLELTMHIRRPEPPVGMYSLSASLNFPEPGEVDRRVISFEISNPK
jgi:hypothetical protein